ncbi:MAG: hypothetical protein JSW08_03295 [archaeon]|nr:MAG: hypothetical protein JSW08_03295 [archaeon]
MPRISKEKEKKIKEAILHLLFENSPKLLFTVQVARELARDEEYTKKLLLDLENQELAISVKKNSQGDDYSRRIRWRLSNKAYSTYQDLFEKKNKFL